MQGFIPSAGHNKFSTAFLTDISFPNLIRHLIFTPLEKSMVNDQFPMINGYWKIRRFGNSMILGHRPLSIEH